MFGIKKWIDRALEKRIQHYFSKNYFEQYFGNTTIVNSVLLFPLKVAGAKNIHIGNDTFIGKHAWVEAIAAYEDKLFHPQISIAGNVYIGNYACITAISKILVEEGCMISDYFYCSDHSHGTNPATGLSPAKQPLFSKGDVIIGRNCFIGYRVSVLPGVQLGENCVVGAHSVVTHSFPANSVIAGVPARLIKNLGALS